MKVLQITPFYPPSLGGVQYFVRGLSRALRRGGHDVDVLTINTEDVEPVKTDSEGVSIRRCALSASYYRGLISVEFAQRLLEARGFDLYHVHVPYAFGLEVAVVASRRNRKPLIATHHGQGIRGDPLYTLIAGSYSLFSRAISLRGVHRLIFLTRSYADSLWLPGTVRRRIRIVRTGADISSFSPDHDGLSVRARHRIREEVPLVLFVGSLRAGNQYKGIDYLIRALPEVKRTVKDVRLMIVGGGRLLAELKALASQLGLDDAIVFTGAVRNDLLPGYYSAADTFVLPSTTGPENSPVVVFEAMASGRPVVASRLPGVCEIVQHEETGLLVPPKDVSALAAALARVLTDSDFRSNAGHKARVRARGYSWDHCAAEMDTVYRELVHP
jgi:glycosyltransferase involved in cell wall biosynthesis